ncbi:hypothetical protein TNCV_1310711 [Trichonephila clavipes]|nr:hypothetical protein TNCV_1310711 [Trichonephila clavipes]
MDLQRRHLNRVSGTDDKSSSIEPTMGLEAPALNHRRTAESRLAQQIMISGQSHQRGGLNTSIYNEILDPREASCRI